MPPLATTPEPPYYSVIFTSTQVDDPVGYSAAAERMLELAAEQPGFLGVESAHDSTSGITVSYWESEAAIEAWKHHVEHTAIRERGRAEWYTAYELRVARARVPLAPRRLISATDRQDATKRST